MPESTPLLRSKYRTTGSCCVTCSGDLAGVESLPGVKDVDALASGAVLITHDGTVADDAVIAAAQKAGITLVAAGPTRPVRA